MSKKTITVENTLNNGDLNERAIPARDTKQEVKLQIARMLRSLVGTVDRL